MHTPLARRSRTSQAQCAHVRIPVQQTPRYLNDHCMPVSDTVFCHRLHSASSQSSSLPRCRLCTYGRQAFLLLVWLSGTHCLKTCGIWSVLQTVTDSHWRHFIFAILMPLLCYRFATRMHYISSHWHWHCINLSLNRSRNSMKQILLVQWSSQHLTRNVFLWWKSHKMMQCWLVVHQDCLQEILLSVLW